MNGPDANIAPGTPVPVAPSSVAGDGRVPDSPRVDAGLPATEGELIKHGTLWTYRHWKCRCVECRRANADNQQRRNAARKAKGLPADDPRHGLASTYINWGCRCDACVAAGSDNNRRLYADRRTRALKPDDHRHGTTNGYNGWGCRCEQCRAAWSDYQRSRRTT